MMNNILFGLFIVMISIIAVVAIFEKVKNRNKKETSQTKGIAMKKQNVLLLPLSLIGALPLIGILDAVVLKVLGYNFQSDPDNWGTLPFAIRLAGVVSLAVHLYEKEGKKTDGFLSMLLISIMASVFLFTFWCKILQVNETLWIFLFIRSFISYTICQAIVVGIYLITTCKESV